MTIESDDLEELPSSGSQITIDEWNIMVRAIKQLLDDVGSGDAGQPSGRVNLTVGTETWTIAGFTDSSNNRWLLVRFTEVDDITIDNADARIPWQLRNP